jgi:hypothetical protein
MATRQQLINEFDTYIRNSGRPYRDWYFGIASDNEKRLFNDHSVDREKGQWIHWLADTAAIAREVEKVFHDAGCKGGPGGGDNTTRGAYAYVITPTTVE